MNEEVEKNTNTDNKPIDELQFNVLQNAYILYIRQYEFNMQFHGLWVHNNVRKQKYYEQPALLLLSILDNVKLNFFYILTMFLMNYQTVEIALQELDKLQITPDDSIKAFITNYYNKQNSVNTVSNNDVTTDISKDQ